jgi:hypothetical protein
MPGNPGSSYLNDIWIESARIKELIARTREIIAIT